MDLEEKRLQQAEKNWTMFLIPCTVLLALVLMNWYGIAGGPGRGMGQIAFLYICIAASFLALVAACCAGRALARHIRLQMPAWLPLALGAGMVVVWVVLVLRLQIWTKSNLLVSGHLPGSITFGIGLLFLGFLALPLLRKGEGISRAGVGAAYLFAVLLAAAYTFLENTFNIDYKTMYHYTATTWPFYNVAFNTPYVINTSSTYGHYAIFFWPVLRLFGHTPLVIAVIMTFCSALSIVLLLWLISRCTRNPVLRLLGALASCSVWVTDMLYPAVLPLRVLWPLVLLVYMFRRMEKGEFCALRSLIAGYVLCGLSIVWNTDTGLVLTAAYTACVWMIGWQQESLFSRRMLRLYAVTVAGCAGAVAEMVAVINVYNLLCGGPLILRACFWPLGTSFSNEISSYVTAVSKAWMLPVCTFVAAISVGLLATCLGGKTLPGGSGKPSSYLALCGMTGLSQCYYFFNGREAGWRNVLHLMVLCMILAVENGAVQQTKHPQVAQGVRGGAAVCSLLYVGMLAINTLLGAPTLLMDRISNAYSMDSMRSVAAKVAASIPANTYAYGYYTQELYAYLGWDPGYHHRDVADIVTDYDEVKAAIDSNFSDVKTGMEDFYTTSWEIMQEVSAQDGVLVSYLQTSLLVNDREMLPENAFAPDGDRVHWFYYYTKNPPVPSVCDFVSCGKQMLPVLQAREQGFLHGYDEYEYWLTENNSLVLNADTLKQTGLEVRLKKPDGRMEANGATSATVTLAVEDQVLGSVELTVAEDERHVYEIEIAPEDLPPVPEDGMYDITLSLISDAPEYLDAGESEVPDGKICHILYAGEPE